MLRLFRHYLDLPSIILASIELVALFLTLEVTRIALEKQGLSLGNDFGSVVTGMVTLVAATGMSSVGLYNRDHFFQMRDVVSRALVAFPLIIIALTSGVACYGWLAGTSNTQSLTILYAVGLVSFFPLLLIGRELFIRLVDGVGVFKRRVLVVGSGKRAAKIDKLSRQLNDRSYTVVGFVRLGTPPITSDHVDPERREGKRRQDFWIAPTGLIDFCVENQVDEVVVASAERRGLPVRELLACKLRGIEVTEYATFWERESGEVDLAEISPSWLLFSDGFLTSVLRSAFKRLFDIVLSLLLLVITLPFTLPTALLIKLESKGPIFYHQERVGYRGKTFMILKFRSMGIDAERNGPRWAAKNDNRVTRVGAFIRKVRIDEIPQVINVLRGDMSFVGPRPERPVFVEKLGTTIPYYHDRHAVKPGITGWAQINYPYGATEEDARMKLAYDLYYIKNSSLFLDNIIILQTVKVLLWNDGAR